MLEGNLPNEILSGKDVKLIIKAINNSRQQYQDWNNERNLGFENGKFLDRWNYIFANIRDSFSSPFKTYPVSRGKLWEFIVLYNTLTNILFLILKEDRFDSIKRDTNNRYHYVRVLNSQNRYLQSEIVQQLDLFGGYQDTPNQYIDEDLESMIGEIKDEVKGCVNVIFRENKDGVCKISGNIANYNLDILSTYDWSKYISAEIDEIIDTKNDYEVTTPKIELSIRKDKIKSRNTDIVDDKSKQEAKEEDKKSE